MNRFILGKRIVGNDYPPLIIAEIGINHNGSLDKVIFLADKPIKAGAEVVKHQTHIPDEEMSIEPTMKRKNLSANRQSFLDLYLPNGAIYIFKAKSFLINNDFSISGAVPYIMDSKSSIDIDKYEDLKKIKKLK